MEELSIEQKVKRYIEQKAKRFDEVLAMAKACITYIPDEVVNKYILNMFPELKESEGEKIRKEIIAFIKKRDRSGCDYDYDKWITWLEKQGEQQPADNIAPYDEYEGLTDFERTLTDICIGWVDEEIGWRKQYIKDNADLLLKIISEKFDLLQEQETEKQSKKQGKSALEAIKEEKVDNSNKVESKFHEGEWVVSNFTGFVYQIKTCIENITNHTYSYDLTTDGYIGIDEVNHYHLWTIQDAKDGDVLTWDDSQCIVLFKNIEDELTFNGHGCVGHCTGVFEAGWSYHDIEGAHPATKEQRDTLFAKMKEAGYEWDAEKKELKKIEQKPAWSEEDEVRLGEAICVNETNGNCVRSKDAVKNISNWLKSLKQRIGWKPSDEQMKALNDMNLTGNISYAGQGQTLIELYNDLKKLKEE